MPRRSDKVLTDKRVRALKPKKKTYEVTDARLPGFGVRITPHGLKTFFYRFPAEGQRRRLALGVYDSTCSGDLARARREAEVARGRILTGKHSVAAATETSSPTFGVVARRWLDEHSKPKRKTWRQDQNLLAKDVFPVWDDVPVDSIRPLMVRKLLQKILPRSGTVANRVHATLRTIFSWAIEEGLITMNPASIRKLHKEEPPKTILSDRDMVILWQCWTRSRSLMGAALCLYLLTGLRNTELRTLPWSQLHGDRFEIPTTKNGEPHTVFLSRQAQLIVAAIQEVTGGSDWLFPSAKMPGEPMSSFARPVERIRKQCDTEHWTVHALRRTASTILARERVEPLIIDVFLNHVVGDVTHRHYVRHRYADQVQEATQALGDYVERCVGPIEGFAIDGLHYGAGDPSDK